MNPTVESQPDSAEKTHAAAQRCLWDTLDERERHVILRRSEGVHQTRIAQELNVSRSVVSRIWQRARRKLRDGFRPTPSQAETAKRSAPEAATMRLRVAKAIRAGLEHVASASGREDFAVFVHAWVEQVRKAISDLGDAGSEGNAREILRLIRDSLLDGGWEAFRAAGTREAVGNLLDLLASAEEVTPRDALRAFDVLDEMGLLSLPPLFSDVEEETAELPD